jgi:TRAP-type C4-dicarboxylate transport system permease small subunit
MKYPQSVSRLNRALGIASGGLIFVVGILSVFEIIMRGVFNRPTAWSLDICQYILIWSIFLGTAYSLQENGHVAVDFVREALG